MALNRWNDRFSKTTRGRILALLRPASRTVDELATAVGLTDNAVRAHLATLERDGLVRASGLRRSGPGKPPQAYAVTPEAERLFFSSACAPFLLQFLRAATARFGGSELAALMHSVGDGLAAGHAPPTGSPRARVEAVAMVLDELGGTTKVENGKSGLVIRSLSCPVGSLVEAHPEVCRAIERFASRLAALPAREHCVRGQGAPRCTLEFAPPPARGSTRRTRH
jgi:predicted ArsR family transcriptional regulator